MCIWCFNTTEKPKAAQVFTSMREPIHHDEIGQPSRESLSLKALEMFTRTRLYALSQVKRWL